MHGQLGEANAEPADSWPELRCNWGVCLRIKVIIVARRRGPPLISLMEWPDDADKQPCAPPAATLERSSSRVDPPSLSIRPEIQENSFPRLDTKRRG